MKKKDYNKWLNHTFSSSTYPLSDYIEFQKEMRLDLKRIAKENNMELEAFNKNHYCFSAVLKDVSEDIYVYVSISDVRFFKNSWYDDVLIRSMKHSKDWTGGTNQRCNWEDIGTKARNIIEQIKSRNIDKEIEMEI